MLIFLYPNILYQNQENETKLIIEDNLANDVMIIIYIYINYQL